MRRLRKVWGVVTLLSPSIVVLLLQKAHKVGSWSSVCACVCVRARVRARAQPLSTVSTGCWTSLRVITEPDVSISQGGGETPRP
jgi:hypothetical protein